MFQTARVSSSHLVLDLLWNAVQFRVDTCLTARCFSHWCAPRPHSENVAEISDRTPRLHVSALLSYIRRR
ncbi:hypothetical protein Misp02_22970 [Microtetraspora sp. NBRC 16547]|nr:hypothetical protein Misp02_22970 [Microtetraspora sp. NBRC 16547]